jgi:hypothetical protein
MSAALENVTLNGAERRTASRLRIGHTVGIRIGRGEGVLVDLSERGARVRHQTLVLRGSTVRFSFDYEDRRFSTSAEVLASRVISLGPVDGTTYESRLRFTTVDAESSAVLALTLESLADRDVRRWVANLRGWNDGTTAHAARLTTGTYLRCRLLVRRWERKWTRDTAQPADGFLLPAGIDESEIRTLCDTYESLDPEGRRVVRLMAAAAVEHADAGTAV